MEYNDNLLDSSIINWVLTQDILKYPENFYNKHIILGSKYSLVVKSKINSFNNKISIESNEFDSRFKGYNILEYFNSYGCIYVLLEIESIDSYKLLETRFRVEAMELPDFTDNFNVPLNYYIITGILPNGTHNSFSQTLPTKHL
jgi:hypothetical protein